MKAILSLLIVMAGSSAFAQYTTEMSCKDARHLVKTHGAIVLYESADIYDRYVSSGYYCATGEITQPAWIHTADSDACFVGYRCQPNPGE